MKQHLFENISIGFHDHVRLRQWGVFNEKKRHPKVALDSSERVLITPP